MIRLLHTLFLCVVLVLTSISFAAARGGAHSNGTEMVICTGTGLIVLTIGDDGEPVTRFRVCPDAISIFTAQLSALEMPIRALGNGSAIVLPVVLTSRSDATLTPSARGPPLGV